MVTDYSGKKISVRLAELERRLEKVEKYTKQELFSEVYFEFSENGPIRSVEKSFRFNALKYGRYNLAINLSTTRIDYTSIIISVYINDVLYGTYSCNAGSDYAFSVDCPFDKGTNQVKLILVGNTKDISVRLLSARVLGYVAYVETENSLSHILHDGTDYVLHCTDGTAVLFAYTPSSGLVMVSTISNVLSCTILGVLDYKLYLLLIDGEHNLIIKTHYISTQLFSSINLNVSGVSSACGYMTDNGFKIYFSMLANIYEGNYDYSQGFSYSMTGRQGLEVYCEPNLSGVLIIVDRFNNAKLVTE